MSGNYRCLLALLLCLTLALPAGVLAQTNGAGKKSAEKVSLDFKDIELADLIQTISELTGRNFVYDETVRGKVTIISPDPMSLDQAYNLFLTVLAVKGFTIVPSGKVFKVIPVRDAKENNLPTVSQDKAFPAEQYITRVVKLENLDATAVATTVLAPLVPKTSSIVAYPPSNSLIITDNAANIERLVKILEVLDVPSALDLLEVIPLQYGDATEVAQLINQILAGGTSATTTRRRATRNVQAAPGAQEQAKVIPYPRTNALVALADEESMATIKMLVGQLDQRTTQEHAGIYVYYLENADAETLATTLNQIVTGIKAQARTPARAARTPQAQPGQPGAQPAALEAVAITADKATNALIVNSTPEDYETLKGIIAQLDVKRKQVFVEALILELSMDATRRLGASLQGAFEVGNDGAVVVTSELNNSSQPGVSLGNLAPATEGGLPGLLAQSISGIMLGGLFNPITVTGPSGDPITIPALSALIDVSKSTSDVNILSAPRLLTTDNEEAEIIVGQNVPIITQRLTDAGASAGLAQSVVVERQDVALTLRFTPQITEGNLVKLNVMQEITDIATTSVGDVNQVGPTLTKRLVRNTVLAENNKTIVLGGLIQNNEQEIISKVPLLGDIPGLGWLFRHQRTAKRKTNLLVFMTPRIIRDAGDLAKVTRRSRADMEEFKADRFVPQVNIDPYPTGETFIIPPTEKVPAVPNAPVLPPEVPAVPAPGY